MTRKSRNVSFFPLREFCNYHVNEIEVFKKNKKFPFLIFVLFCLHCSFFFLLKLSSAFDLVIFR